MRVKKYYKLIRVDYSDSEYFRITNIDSVAGTITFERMSGKNIEYSTDGVNWTTLDLSTGTNTITAVAPGANVYLRGTNSVVGGNIAGKRITADFSHSLGGNICSLLDKTNFPTMTSITSNYALGYLFYQDTKLVNAGFNFGNVPSLGGAVLTGMFQECSALVTTPDLSNITSLGDNAMQDTFRDCTSLVTAPDLSSITSLGVRALYSAFEGCRALVTAPDLSNITSIGNQALYGTFDWCTILQTIYVPNVDTWEVSKFTDWVMNAGLQTTSPKQMIFQTQALLDTCPSGGSGYGRYTKVLAQ